MRRPDSEHSSPLDPDALRNRFVDTAEADERSRGLDERYSMIRAILYGSYYDNGRVLRTDEKVTVAAVNRHWSEWQISDEAATRAQLRTFSERSGVITAKYKDREGRNLFDSKGDRLLRVLAYYPLWHVLEKQEELEQQKSPPEEAERTFEAISQGILRYRDRVLGSLAAEAILQHGE